MISKTKTKVKAKDKKQSKRFIAKAREIGADESGEAFERGFRKVIPPKQPAKGAGITGASRRGRAD